MHRDILPKCLVVKDQFWITVEERMEAQLPFGQSSDSSGENISSDHMTPFMDHKVGEGIFINPRSTLRMTIEKVEVPW